MQAPSGVTKKVLIAGGGIAGPVAAVALRRAGMDVEMYEGRGQEADDAGLFLGLGPNGIDVLETLGIAGAALGAGFDSDRMIFENHRGKILGEMAYRNVVVKRGLFNRALREAAAEQGASVQFGKRLQTVEITPAQTVVARFEDGTEARGDVLLGCDGIHSPTRRAILPDAPQPTYTGVLNSGGFAPGIAVQPADGAMMMTFGLRGFFGYVAMPSGDVGWFDNFAGPAQPDRDAVERMPAEQWRQKLLQIHAGDHEPIGRILRAAKGPMARLFTYDMPPLPTWHSGPVCLIGDAAHATSPHIGQGASLAIEDAIEVARCLRDLPDADRAFQVFESLRKERVDKLVKEARRSGNQKAISNPIARWLRDLALPFFLRKGLGDAERTFEHHTDWEERVA